MKTKRGKKTADPTFLTVRKPGNGKKNISRIRSGSLQGKGNTPFRSGVIPYLLEDDGTILVMMVTPVGGGRWIFPKGNIAKGMSSLRSAEKEAYEEAGIRGISDNVLLGVSRFAHKQFIEFYPMHITEILKKWEEAGKRSRLFFPLEEAKQELNDPEATAILDQLRKYLTEKEIM